MWKNNEKIVYCRQRNVDHGATIQTPPIIIFPAHLNTPFHFILSLSLVLFSHSIPVHHKKMSIICIWLTGAFFPFFAFYYKILKMCFPATKNNNKQEYKKKREYHIERIASASVSVIVFDGASQRLRSLSIAEIFAAFNVIIFVQQPAQHF